ncbi:hypothetical protein QBC47DRAFT_406496 [Echria macrotheca]|uniref:BZIP domain-containing protein n=1 Tax=Echria macrotheca TaxID=438768 RepID=A0AAJ0F738_9PEZI|nr:hypothetical protein QBC47DRAFT_406496 [Echria macrotheca]
MSATPGEGSPPSEEPTKVPKRKGGRSVKNLTSAQLERKRQNDREAQRAIRFRTKQHIASLQQEVDQLRRDGNLQEVERLRKLNQDLQRQNQYLQRQNQDLQMENRMMKLRLRGSQDHCGISDSPYPTPAYAVEGASPTASLLAGCESSLGQGSNDVGTPPPGYTTPFPIPTPGSCENWAQVDRVSAFPVASSPDSSPGYADDYATRYIIPTSVPTSMMGSGVVPQVNAPYADERVDYQEVDTEQGFSQQSVPHTTWEYTQLQNWRVYPTPPSSGSPNYQPPPPPPM